MARFLALDWDNREYHLVAGNVHRGKVQIEAALSWREEEPFVPAKAEQFGKRLSDELSKAGIAAAPIIVGLGRDRVVLKEVRFPQVAPEVEAAVVRNQIIKDLTDAPDDVLLDYAPLTEVSRNGERRALALVVRKDLIAALQTIGRVAGLKIAAVTARPFGVAACLSSLAGVTPHVPAPPAANAVAGVLTVTPTWAEFCAVRGQQLLFARSMAGGDGLLGEVRRNLAAYAGQPQLTFPRDAIQALYVSGNGENAVLREKLQQTLGIPVHGLDPFASEERVSVDAANRAGFTGAVGLLQLWAVDQATPVNFIKPRESKPVGSPAKRRVLAYSGLGVVVCGFLIALAIWTVNVNHGKAAELREEAKMLSDKLKELEPELKYLEALGPGGWTDAAFPWADELYDLAARIPFEKGFTINRIDYQASVPPAAKPGAPGAAPGKAAPPPGKGKAKGKEIVDASRFTGKLKIIGSVDRAKETLIQRMVKELNKDDFYRATVLNTKKAANDKVEFAVNVDLMHRPKSADYTARLNLPTPPPGQAKKLIVQDDDDN